MTSYHRVISNDDIIKNVHEKGREGTKIAVEYRLEYRGLTQRNYREYIRLIGRFLKNALFLSNHGLGPRVLDVDIENVSQNYYSLAIVYEKIQVIDATDQNTFPDDPDNLIVEITRVIRKLHSLGYGHGDIVGNIGYRVTADGYQILLLDPDSMFKINKVRAGNDRYFIKWAQKGYDLYDMSTDEMVNELLTNDLTAWMSDELDLDQSVIESGPVSTT
jgi:hypothetical protein